MASNQKSLTLGSLIFNIVMTSIVFPTLTLGLAGDWHWIEGWIFGLWMVVMILSVTIYLYIKDPMLLAERTKAPGSDNQKEWDKYLLIGIFVTFVLWLIIMPLDAKRFGWSPIFPVWLKIIGGLILLPSLYFIYMPTVENTYLSTMVRIQDERKQHVISTGVYSFVRHPLYFGCLLMLIGAPLLLGSVVGLVISFFALITLVLRIIGEERMLVEELEGYVEYRKKVKFRLIPPIW